MTNIKDIAESWIFLQKEKEGSAAYVKNFWAYNALDEFCENKPDQCLAVINEILQIDNSDVVLVNLAAGPIEDLLVRHGELVIKSIMKFAKDSSDWKKMLGAVWQNDISDHVWQQLKSVANPSW